MAIMKPRDMAMWTELTLSQWLMAIVQALASIVHAQKNHFFENIP
jgi:hypothetical protein